MNIWTSDSFFFSPLDLRKWMLEFAGQIYPSLVVPTIERYWNKLHEKSGIENPNTVGRGLEGTITASGRPTKKLMLPRKWLIITKKMQKPTSTFTKKNSTQKLNNF
jgi:hypothetical protein